MTPPDRATAWARTLVDELARAGVTDVCLAPGSRSTPLVLAAARHPGLRLRVFLDERSAAFFALGLGKARGRPAVVLTTSGTAVANLFPAVVEAAQSETPLLVLTADRPPRLRDADANQTIDQVRIFGAYVRMHADAGLPGTEPPELRHLRSLAGRAVAAAVGLPGGPVHLNMPFEKPLEPAGGEGAGEGAAEATGEAGARAGGRPWVRIGVRRPRATDDEVAALASALETAARPVLVAGPHAQASALGAVLRTLAAAAQVPLLADPLSGGRFGAGDLVPRMGAYDLLLRDPVVRDALRPDLVLRVGQAPTSTALLAWLERHDDVPQTVIDAGERWKDHLARASHYVRADPVDTLERMAARLAARTDGEDPGNTGAGPAEGAGAGDRSRWTALWHRLDRAAREARDAPGLPREHEGVVARALLAALPEGTPLFVSSSMPVRDVDAFGDPSARALPVYGNRGASGIDGIVSTALGVAAGARRPAVCLLGDLALLHDVNGLLATREDDASVVFVVVNNDGGGIFHMLPVRAHEPDFTPYFATPHGIQPARAAALYGVPHRLVKVEELPDALAAALTEGGSAVLEIPTEREANRIGHEAVAAAVARVARETIRGSGQAAPDPSPTSET